MDQTINTILTPGIIYTCIGCATTIILGSFGVSLARIIKAKEYKPGIGMYIFYASMFVLICISIFSYHFYGNKNVLDFISLASALVSIILAVITIIYSFYTNSHSSDQLTMLNQAANKVNEAAERYNGTAQLLNSNINTIIERINSLAIQTNQLHKTLRASLIKNENSTDKHNNVLHTEDNFDLKKYIETFTSIISRYGKIALYACVKARDTKVNSFPFNLICKDKEDISYVFGFLVASTAAGIINANIDTEKFIITVDSYISFLSDPLNEEIKTMSEDKKIAEIIRQIDDYFEAQSKTSSDEVQND